MRKPLDAYYTPTSATESLIKHIPTLKYDWVVEPCVGTGEISKLLSPTTLTCDIDPSVNAMYTADMSTAKAWRELELAFGRHEWVVTNPPFSHALEIAQHGLAHTTGGMALLLRLSFLEPTYKRQDWLSKHPPHQLIVLPRISFTGDGKTDSVTCAWMIWYKNASLHRNIEIIKKP